MEKAGKVILIGVVLIIIAVPLGFLIKYNFSQRLVKVTSQGIDISLGLNSLDIIDEAKEAVGLSNQTNQEIEQAIKDLTEISTSSQETTTSSQELPDLSSVLSTSSATSTN